LHRNQHWLHRPESIEELFNSLAVSGDRKGRTTRTHVHVQPILRHIDANESLFHGDPSLRKRARYAAQATVRVRWNGGRGAELRSGLASPRTRRAPVRHRTSQSSRFADSRLTRMRAGDLHRLMLAPALLSHE